MKIAVYAIALNEEKHVMRWLEATKDADVRLVADTGSTDRTVKILQGAPNVIVHQISVQPFRFDDAIIYSCNDAGSDVVIQQIYLILI